jgi:hypothetical protein
VVVKGPLDKEIIRRVLRRKLDEFKNCYLAALPSKPELGGRISLRFEISSSGRVIDPALESSQLKNVRVEGCILKALRSTEFPRPLGHASVTVTYPLHFSSGASVQASPIELVE